MILILLATALMVPITTGYGSLFSYHVLGSRAKDLSFGELGVLGFLLIGILTILTNFFLPISYLVSIIFCSGGLLAFVAHYKKFKTLFHGKYHFALLCILIFIFGGYAIENGWAGDTGNYHLPSMIWIHQSKTVIGLANVYWSFAFNSIWFPISAAFWLPGFELTAAFSCMAALGIFFYLILFEPFFKKKEASPSRVFALAALLFFCFEKTYFLKILGSPSTDLPSSYIGILALYTALRIFEMDQKDQRRIPLIALQSFLSFFAVAIKLSLIPLAVLPMYFLWNIRKENKSIFVHLSFMAIAWLTRSLLVSGCLAYPMAASCFPILPWSLTRESARLISSWVTSWARVPWVPFDQTTGWTMWLKPWWHNTWGSEVVKLSIYFSAIGVILFCFGLFKKNAGLKGKLLLVPAVCFLGLAFWFYFGPDLRFGFCFIISAGLLIFTQGFLKSNLSKHFKAIATPIAILGFLIMMNATFELTIRNMIQRPFVKWPNLPHVSFIEFKNVDGETFFATDPNVDKKYGRECWDIPLPCFQTPDPKVIHDKSGFWEEFKVLK